MPMTAKESEMDFEVETETDFGFTDDEIEVDIDADIDPAPVVVDLDSAIREELEGKPDNGVDVDSDTTLDLGFGGPATAEADEILLENIVDDEPLNPFATEKPNVAPDATAARAVDLEEEEEDVELALEDITLAPAQPAKDREPVPTPDAAVDAAELDADDLQFSVVEQAQARTETELDVDGFLSELLADKTVADRAPMDLLDTKVEEETNTEVAATLRAEVQAAAAGAGGEQTTQIFAPTPEVPALVVSVQEPAPRPSEGAEALRDPSTLRTLEKLAGKAQDQGGARKALLAALRDEPFDPSRLPDARTLVLGLAKVLIAQGTPADNIVNAVISQMKS